MSGNGTKFKLIETPLAHSIPPQKNDQRRNLLFSYTSIAMLVKRNFLTRCYFIISFSFLRLHFSLFLSLLCRYPFFPSFPALVLSLFLKPTKY